MENPYQELNYLFLPSFPSAHMQICMYLHAEENYLLLFPKHIFIFHISTLIYSKLIYKVIYVAYICTTKSTLVLYWPDI